MVELNIFVFSHPNTGTPRPFTLSVTTQDGTASMHNIEHNNYIMTPLQLYSDTW